MNTHVTARTILRRFLLSAFSAALLLAVYAQAAFAHVKWFVPDEESVTQTSHTGPVYGLFETPTLVWIGLAVVILVIARFLDKRIPEPKKLTDFAVRNERKIVWIFQVLVGVFLIVISLSWNIVLAPEIPVTSTAAIVLRTVQLLTGILCVTNVAPQLAALLLVVLYAACGYIEGFTFLLENVLLLGIAGFIFIKHSRAGEWTNRFARYAIPLLRLCAGISLIVLAFTDKLLYPELPMAFLQTHHWNFMQGLGITSFSNQLFILCAGATEVIFGLVFIFGYVNRINTVVMASFFAMSVTAMAIQFRKWEVEDLAVYAVAVIILFFGSGKLRKTSN